MVLIRRTESARRGGSGPRPVFGRDGCGPETTGEERAGAGLDQRAVEVPVVGGGLPQRTTARGTAGTKETASGRARGVGPARGRRKRRRRGRGTNGRVAGGCASAGDWERVAGGMRTVVGAGRTSASVGSSGTVFCGTSSAWARGEARIELLNPALPRALFCMSSALPTRTDPGYQTRNGELSWVETSSAVFGRATKHTLSV